MGLSPDMGADSKKIEDLSKVVCEVQESFCYFYSPAHDFDKITNMFNKILDTGIYDIFLEHVRKYSEVQAKHHSSKKQEVGFGED